MSVKAQEKTIKEQIEIIVDKLVSKNTVKSWNIIILLTWILLLTLQFLNKNKEYVLYYILLVFFILTFLATSITNILYFSKNYLNDDTANKDINVYIYTFGFGGLILLILLILIFVIIQLLTFGNREICDALLIGLGVVYFLYLLLKVWFKKQCHPSLKKVLFLCDLDSDNSNNSDNSKENIFSGLFNLLKSLVKELSRNDLKTIGIIIFGLVFMLSIFGLSIYLFTKIG